MATKPIRPLSERVAGYPTCAPQDTRDLINADVDTLKGLACSQEEIDAVLEHRKDVINAIHSNAVKAITSPEVVLQMLSGKSPLLRPLAGGWITYVLDARRERKLVPSPNGEDMTYLRVMTRKVPTWERLQKEAPLPAGGCYLMIYGGTPDVISKWTVADELQSLFSHNKGEEIMVTDALFWHLESGKPPTLYSLRKGIGDQGGEAVPFPDEELMRKARNDK